MRNYFSFFVIFLLAFCPIDSYIVRNSLSYNLSSMKCQLYNQLNFSIGPDTIIHEFEEINKKFQDFDCFQVKLRLHCNFGLDFTKKYFLRISQGDAFIGTGDSLKLRVEKKVTVLTEMNQENIKKVYDSYNPNSLSEDEDSEIDTLNGETKDKIERLIKQKEYWYKTTKGRAHAHPSISFEFIQQIENNKVLYINSYSFYSPFLKENSVIDLYFVQTSENSDCSVKIIPIFSYE